MAKNAFDELLESVSNEDHRKALAEVAEAVPELKNSVLRQSDCSRRMDELRKEREQFQDKLSAADEYVAWWKENYVPDALGDGKGATKRELEWKQRVEQLEQDLQQASVGGDSVTFEELNAHLEKSIGELGLVRKADIEREKAGVEQLIQQNMMGYAHIATKLPTLAIRHYRTYGEELDGDKLVEFAAKGYNDLGKAYEDFTVERRREQETKEIEAKLEAAKKAGYESALKERGMNPESMPVDGGTPQMGHFQAKILGLTKGADGSTVVADSAEIGSGAIAAAAARNWDRG